MILNGRFAMFMGMMSDELDGTALRKYGNILSINKYCGDNFVPGGKDIQKFR